MMHGKYILLMFLLIGCHAEGQAQESVSVQEDYSSWELLKPEFEALAEVESSFGIMLLLFLEAYAKPTFR